MPVILITDNYSFSLVIAVSVSVDCFVSNSSSIDNSTSNTLSGGSNGGVIGA